MRPLRARNARSIASGFGPSMTPMVDVTLVILIFFMASAAAFGPERMLRTVVHTSDDAAGVSPLAIEAPRFRVVVDREGVIRGAGIEASDGASFASTLVGSMPGVQPSRLNLSVEPEPGAPWESVVVLLAELREAGVTDAPLGVTGR
ncbi:MAG: biopolymer transporter ExbD [Planctomycetota bacterium]